LPDPRELVGLAARELERRLGSPSLRRREPPAEVWQYRTAGCVLHVFLYPGAAGPAVSHVEARPRNGAAMSADSDRVCLAGIIAENAPAGR
jgi:hypothetical protein